MVTGSKDCVTLASLKENGHLSVMGHIELNNVLACQFDLEGKLWLMRVNPAGKSEVKVYNISENGKVSNSFIYLFIYFCVRLI